MKKLFIISAFVLFAFSACEDNLNISEEIAAEKAAFDNVNPDIFQYQSNMPRDGRNPQTGETLICPTCGKTYWYSTCSNH